MGCIPELKSFMWPIDKDIMGFIEVESSTNAGRIFLYRNLATLDYCEAKYKEE